MEYYEIAKMLAQPRCRVAGLKQVQRAILAGQVQAVVLAQDADESIAREVKALCTEHAAPCIMGPGKAALGAACRLQVGAAVAAILK